MPLQVRTHTLFLLLAGAASAWTAAPPPPPGTLPAGTVLEIRLISPVASFSSHAGDSIDAFVVAPVRVDGATLIPIGARVLGHLVKVKRVGWGVLHETATLQFAFTDLDLPAQQAKPIQVQITEVENAREQVTRTGEVKGIRSTGTYGYRANNFIAGLALVDPIAYVYVNVAATRVLRFSEPEIWLPAGTEMNLRLTTNLVLTQAYNDEPPRIAAPGAQSADLQAFIKTLPFRTYTENSNKPSDLTNLMFLGSPAALQRAFQAAGWVESDKLNTISGFMTLRSIAEDQGYQSAPMSTLLLDEQRPDLTLSKTLNTFSKRHHTRMWARAETWRGMPVMTASSTQDIGIALSRTKRRFIHVIDTSIDNERAKIVNDLIFTGCVDAAQLVQRPWVPLDAQNATGEDLITDGRIAVLELNACREPQHPVDLEAAPSMPATGRAGERGFRQGTLMLRNDLYRGNLIYQSYEGVKFSARYLSKKSDEQTEPARGIDVKPDSASGDHEPSTRPVSFHTAKSNALKEIKDDRLNRTTENGDAVAPKFEFGLEGGYFGFGSNTLDFTRLDLEPKTPEVPLIRLGLQNRLHSGWSAGTTITLNSFRYFSSEFGFFYQRGKYRLGASFFGGFPENLQGAYDEETTGLLSRQFGYSLVANLRPREKRFRPYIAAGPVLQLFNITDAPFKSSGGLFKVGLRNVGFLLAAYNFGSAPPLNGGGIFQMAFQYGGGFKYRVSRSWQVKLDYRETLGPQPDFVGRSFHIDDTDDSAPYIINVERNRPGDTLRQRRLTMGFSFSF